MPADQDAAGTATRGPGGRALPPQALAALREAFAVELAERLPRLQAVRPEVVHGEQLVAAVRDAHTLGSSAVVVGEPRAARAARVVESALLAGELADVPAHVRALAEELAGWRA